VERMREQQVAFTVASTTSRRSWRPWRRASIEAMLQAGLNVIPCSDDPGMFPTSLAQEYRIMTEQIGATRSQLAEMAVASIDASWLPAERKAAAHEAFRADVEAFRAGGTLAATTSAD